MDDDPIDPLVEKLYEQLAQIETMHRESSGPCSTCRFSGWEQSPRHFGMACRNPLLTNPKFDAVRGSVKHEVVMCDNARSKFGDCGPEGRLWMPQEQTPEPELKPSFLKRIFG